MKKGILITSPKEIAIGGGISFSSLDRRDLRKALTYWDEIAYLTNNLVYQSDDELDKLKEFGAASELNTPDEQRMSHSSVVDTCLHSSRPG